MDLDLAQLTRIEKQLARVLVDTEAQALAVYLDENMALHIKAQTPSKLDRLLRILTEAGIYEGSNELKESSAFPLIGGHIRLKGTAEDVENALNNYTGKNLEEVRETAEERKAILNLRREFALARENRILDAWTSGDLHGVVQMTTGAILNRELTHKPAWITMSNTMISYEGSTVAQHNSSNLRFQYQRKAGPIGAYDQAIHNKLAAVFGNMVFSGTFASLDRGEFIVRDTGLRSAALKLHRYVTRDLV